MAVLDHFSAYIVIDDEPCAEYAVEEGEERSDTTSEESSEISKYVEVVAGAEFAVRIEPIKSFEFGTGDALLLDVLSNAKRMAGVYKFKEDLKVKDIFDIKGETIGDGSSFRTFKFGNINFSKSS